MAPKAVRFSLWLTGAIALVLTQTAAAPPSRTAAETALKAAYLYKFGSFVEWPATAFASSDAPLVICVIGQDPFGLVLDQVVDNQTINDRPVQIRRMQRPYADVGCHIAYAAPTEGQPVAAVLSALKNTHTLTVTDGVNSGAARGMVHFRVVQNRLRFDIDLQAASEGQVTISSKLLSLAATVRRAGRSS